MRKAISLLIGILLVASSLFVFYNQANGTPYTGQEPYPTNLTLYMHNSVKPYYVGSTPALNLLNTVNDTNNSWKNTGKLDTGLHYVSVQFYLYPQLMGNLVLNGSPVLDIYLNQTGSSSGGSISYSLYSLSPNGSSSLIGTSSAFALSNVKYGSTPSLEIIPFGSPISYNVPENYSIEVQIVISGTSSNYYGIWWGLVDGTYYFSSLNLPVSSYLNVGNISTYVKGSAVSVLPRTGNTTAMVVANISDPLGTYDFANWSVNFKLENSTTTLISSDMKTMTPLVYTRSYELYYFEFNYSSLSPGKYIISVNVTDNTYHNLLNQNTGSGYYGRNAFGFSYIWIGGKPVSVYLQVLDSSNNSVQNATIKIFSSNTFIEQNITNISGFSEFELNSNSSYIAIIFFEGVNVGKFTFNVSSNSSIYTFKTLIFSPTILIEDYSGRSVSNALTYLISPSGYHYPLIVSGANGTVYLREAPIGNYSITVIWHDTVVYSSSVFISTNSVYKIVSRIYNQEFKILEPDGTPINLAYVLVYNLTSDVIIGFNYTNQSGLTNILIPSGNYSVKVFWKTSDILQTIISEPNVPSIVLVGNLKNITIFTHDYLGTPIGNVVIDIYQNNSLAYTIVSDGRGMANELLSPGNYSLKFTYFGYTAGYYNISVSSNSSINVTLPIYPVSLTTLDSRNSTVSFVQIEVYNSLMNGYESNISSDSNGVAFIALPAGEYYVKAFYLGTEIYASTFNVSGPLEINLHTDIFYLTILAKDNQNSTISSAFIEIYKNGTLIQSGITGNNGMLVVRLPKGSYEIKAYFIGNYLLTPEKQSEIFNITVNSSAQFNLTFSKINIPFYQTYLFYISLLFLLLIIMFIYVFKRKTRK
ncbi:MAG: hypothetical protein ACP5TG_05750 [Thermoplasmata archaeon]